MRLSLHVDEKGPVVCPPPDSLHPTQGALPCLRLDSQPPLQLLEILSSLASFPNVEPGPAMIASAGYANALRVFGDSA